MSSALELRTQLRGLYAITPQSTTTAQPIAWQVSQALSGGAKIIQYRDKGSSPEQKEQDARALAKLCKDAGALFIINDDVTLAIKVDADGVHLGKDDPDITTARQRLGQEKIIGTSCYNKLELALQAEQAGVDYIAFGRFFPSRTKPEAIKANPQLLEQARQQLQIPVVAIGGITPENGPSLIQAGADMLAVINGIFGQHDIKAACEAFQSLFKPLET